MDTPTTSTPARAGVNQTGVVLITPGDAASPVLLHVPHAGTQIPAWTRPSLTVSDAELAAEIGALTDHATDTLALAAAERAAVRPWVIVNPVSRFVVDVERFPDSREEMLAVGMGAVYTHGTRGQRLRKNEPGHAAALVARYFRPWGVAVGALVEAGRRVLLDIHSYPRDPLPYERHGAGPRPEVCLGTDRLRTPPWLLDASRAAFAGFEVGLNSPFGGCYAPAGHLVASVMVEIRRDVHAGREAELVAALASLGETASTPPPDRRT